MPLVALERISIAFGHVPLVDEATLQIDAGERVAVIGRNGAGKSTLLQLISGELAPDAGTAWRAPGLRAARLVQDVPLSTDRSVFDVVIAGLGEGSDLLARYHAAATRVADDGSDEALTALGRLQHELEGRDGWRLEQRVELVLSRLGLTADARVDSLSGGWRRRVLLAQALVSSPDLLLLDEPTNHLDVEAIEWLEAFLREYAGAVVFVTHDRTFLQRVATRIVELDRGRLTSWPGDYAGFLEKKEALLADEAVAIEKFDKRLVQEEAWLRRGVRARRTRDEGRVRALLQMREARAARRATAGAARINLDAADPSGRVVFDVERITKAYGGTPVVRDFSTRVMRGDRIGLIGPNGAGKTTMLRLLIGELAPDAGEVHRGAGVQIAYFDQQREQLDPERTLVDTVAGGNDTVTVGGVTRHVYGYLEDFLFPPARARSLVKTLSGGERNRLLLARLLTRPANVLVLDEPTNDLDIETLELVEAQLADFPGTILLVSHDRTFLDHVVTSTLAPEGDGVWAEYVGGYDDWLRQRQTPASGAAAAAAAPPTPRPRPAQKLRLSYKEQREFEGLPARIATLEAEAAQLDAAVAAPGFYKEPREVITGALDRQQTLREALEAAYRRWDELDARLTTSSP